jgi:hypothetical protein
MAAKGEINPNDPRTLQTAFRETLILAMIDWPKCAHYLGLAFIASEQPTVLRLVPKYAQEFADLQRTSAALESNQSSATAAYMRLNPSMRVETSADGSTAFTSVHQAPKRFSGPLIQRVGEREFMQDARNAVRPHFPASARKQTTSDCPSCGLLVRFKVANGEQVEVVCRNCDYIFDYIGGAGIQRLQDQ